MKRDILTCIIVCGALGSGCVHFPHNYYAPSASGGIPVEFRPDCPKSLDWIQVSDGGAYLYIHAVRRNKVFIFLNVNKFKINAPTIKVNLIKVSITDPSSSYIYFPLSIDQLDFRKSPVSWPIEPVLITNEGYYRLTYSDINADRFILELPEVFVGDRIIKFSKILFEKRFGFTCESGN